MNTIDSFIKDFQLIDNDTIADESLFYEDEGQQDAFETGMIRGEILCKEWMFNTMLLKFIYFLNEKEINDNFNLDNSDWNELRKEFVEYLQGK